VLFRAVQRWHTLYVCTYVDTQLCNKTHRMCVQMYCTYVQMYCTYVQIYCTYVQMYCTYEQMYCTYVQMYCTIYNCTNVHWYIYHIYQHTGTKKPHSYQQFSNACVQKCQENWNNKLTRKTKSVKFLEKNFSSADQHHGFKLKRGCQIFILATYQNGKIYQNDHKIYQMAIKYTK
jgi:hypothetical protein